MRTVLLIGLFGCVAAASLGHTVTAAESPGFLSVALSCAPGLEGPDCDRSNALDVLAQPSPSQGQCLKLAELLAVHLSLQPGGWHKAICERRRG